jgi:hypothetical protein
VDHAGGVLAGHGFGGVVVEGLAEDEDDFAVAGRLGCGEGDAGGEGDVAGHFFPEITELVAGVPDVVAGGVDGVLAGCGVEGGGAGDEGGADVGLAVEDADGGGFGAGGAVEVFGRRDLSVGGGTGLGPVGCCGGLGLKKWGGTESEGEDEVSHGISRYQVGRMGARCAREKQVPCVARNGGRRARARGKAEADSLRE